MPIIYHLFILLLYLNKYNIKTLVPKLIVTCTHTALSDELKHPRVNNIYDTKYTHLK